MTAEKEGRFRIAGKESDVPILFSVVAVKNP